MDAVERQAALPTEPGPALEAPLRSAPDVPDLCPYLATDEGTWRSSTAVREHRCMAVTPPVPLALEKQRRLCLVADHANCATYGAALAAHPPPARQLDPGVRPIARTTPLVLDHGRFDLRLPLLRPTRVTGQAALVGLLGIAFAAVLIARPTGDGRAADTPAGAVGSTLPSASIAVDGSAQPSGSRVPSAAPVVTARPIGSPASSSSGPAASAPGSATPGPTPATGGSRYKVRSGDTLSAIASRYGTTVKALMTLNGLSDPSRLRVGQILKVP
jgi:LysM repeat protein